MCIRDRHSLSVRKGDFSMDRSFDELEAIVRNRICSVCTERTTEGQCDLESPSSCALFRLFPQVVQAIQSVDSNDIHQYIEAIRRNVCSVCQEQARDGSCEVRQQVQCALDAVSYTHLRAHETDSYLVCRLLLEK